MKLTVLASSSAGNCSVISTEKTHLLVDAGLPAKTTFKLLLQAGIAPEDLTAIVLSHEHSDHVAGLQAIARKLDIPVYLTAGTAAEIRPLWKPGYTPTLGVFLSCSKNMPCSSSFPVGDIEVTGFPIPHDAAEPVGFTFRAAGIKMAIVTDLGHLTETLRENLAGADVILLESNHDLGMLKVGPYPWPVKERIMSLTGHLSNEIASNFIRDSLDGRTSTLILGHLSVGNNHPEIARLMAEEALGRRDTRLLVAGTDAFGSVDCG